MDSSRQAIHQYFKTEHSCEKSVILHLVRLEVRCVLRINYNWSMWVTRFSKKKSLLVVERGRRYYCMTTHDRIRRKKLSKSSPTWAGKSLLTWRFLQNRQRRTCFRLPTLSISATLLGWFPLQVSQGSRKKHRRVQTPNNRLSSEVEFDSCLKDGKNL